MTVENALSAESSQTFADGVGLWLSTSGQFFVGTNDTTIFYAAKLELGPAQTLAYQDEEGNWKLFETPDYAEELAKCQRYLWISSVGFNFEFVSSSRLIANIMYPQKMRTIPTISVVSHLGTNGVFSNWASLLDTDTAFESVVNGADDGLYAIAVNNAAPSTLYYARITASAEL